MSTVSIIICIVVLLIALVCYAFAMQNIQNKKEQRKRLLIALQSQARGFKFILSGCPEGFLPKDLKLIVLKNVIDVFEQLSRLDPKDNSYLQELQTYTNQLAETQREQQTDAHTAMQSLEQIKSVKICLEELNRFVHNIESQSKISKSQADHYRGQIQQMLLQVTVDGYAMSGNLARQGDKHKLALHYYDLAKKLLLRDGKTGKFDNSIALYSEIIGDLQEKLAEEELAEGKQQIDPDQQAELDEEWDKFSADKEEGVWKKKQIYD